MTTKYSKTIYDRGTCERCNNHIDISYNFNMSDKDDENCHNLSSGEWKYNDNGRHKHNRGSQRVWTCEYCIKYLKLYNLIDERSGRAGLIEKYLLLESEHEKLKRRINAPITFDVVIYDAQIINVPN
jgi:hypothetical protein